MKKIYINSINSISVKYIITVKYFLKNNKEIVLSLDENFNLKFSYN